MEKFKALLKSKKFWTLVAAIVAAFTAFFTTSCSASARVQRSGIHIDTVRVDYIIRSRNVQTASVCPTDLFNPIRPLSTPTFGQFIPASGTFTTIAITMNSLVIPFVGSSFSRRNLTPIFCGFMNPSSFMKLISVPVSNRNCSMVPSGLSVASLSPVLSCTSGEKCLIAFVPIAFVKRSRRRGGRRGKPRPSTKTVTLGGSHL